ncbi:MAG: nicotinate (nicotinamide) nucleotide adenylyltransferase [Candidatus Borkfalkiaceae bacterium]|nr:nicotinate (nicotinamide) nucleotide adenylyltransferase [Clostridia bacterium]MDY6223770.1 nicotinate (nicotinamide) nucleotide adenylyltransferase [Christensenellaceae bacterium]
MKTGIFGGSFDPVHTEHVALARAAVQTLALDRVFVLPARIPPHKRGRALSADEHRIAMLKTAFESVPQAIVSDFELRREGVSYSYLTCAHFAALYPQDTLYFLVGTDMLRDFPAWKNPEEILKFCTLAVCDRAERSADWEKKEQAAFFARFGKTFQRINYTAKSVSSTQARVLAAAGDDVSALCGAAVAEYISKNKLYEIPGAHAALANEKPERREHSLRVGVAAAKKALELHIDEKAAVTAALFHDCAKNLPLSSPLLKGFTPPENAPLPVPAPVLHQFTGAYVANRAFGVTDADILNAICYHTSGRAEMSLLEQLVFLADMVEDGRTYPGAAELRSLYYAEKGGLDFTMFEALKETLYLLKRKGGDIYPLTAQASAYFERRVLQNETDGTGKRKAGADSRG